LSEPEYSLLEGSLPIMSLYAREFAARQQRNWEQYSGPVITGTAELKTPAGSELPPTFQQRKEDLQTLATTPAGREELQGLASRYEAASGRLRAASTPVLTYILLHEREQGLIRR
jgi:hypothetical protein